MLTAAKHVHLKGSLSEEGWITTPYDHQRMVKVLREGTEDTHHQFIHQFQWSCSGKVRFGPWRMVPPPGPPRGGRVWVSVWMESLYRVPGEHHHTSHCTAVASLDL